MSWLDLALNPFPDMFAMPPCGVSAKVKDALLRGPVPGPNQDAFRDAAP